MCEKTDRPYPGQPLGPIHTAAQEQSQVRAIRDAQACAGTSAGPVNDAKACNEVPSLVRDLRRRRAEIEAQQNCLQWRLYTLNTLLDVQG